MTQLVSGALAPVFTAESFDGRRIDLGHYLTHSHVLLLFLRGFA